MQTQYSGIEYVKNSKPPIVRFHLKLTNSLDKLLNAFNFKAELKLVTGKNDEHGREVTLYLGILSDPNNQVLRMPPKDSRDIYLDYTLYPYNKHIIDEYRDGDLEVNVLIRYLTQDLGENHVPELLRSQWSHVMERHSADLRIHNSEWSNILTQAGFDSYQIIELPIDYDDITKSINELVENEFSGQLKKARDQLTSILKLMDEGRWAQAVGQSRIALEALTKGGGTRKINEILTASGFPDKNIQSFRQLLEHLSSYSSLTHHAQVNGKDAELIVPMGREDALFIVSSLATIINLLSRKHRYQLK